MNNDIREQAYHYFAQEAPELLQALEQELFSLAEERTLVKVHNLMRITHTLKGAAANVELETIKTIAHHLEDVFKALYNPDLVIDTELETLLLQGYECLRLPLIAEITGGYVNNDEITERVVSVFAQLQEKLGDYFDCEAPIPTSVELGFDIIQSIFEVGVKQRLESLAEILLTNSDPAQVAPSLRDQAEIFVGLAESLNLPGFGAIASSTLAALDAHPQAAHRVLEVALNDFQAGWNAVIAGDRTLGGEPSLELQQLGEPISQLEINEAEIEEFKILDCQLQIESEFGNLEPLSFSELEPDELIIDYVDEPETYSKVFCEVKEGSEFEIVPPELTEDSDNLDWQSESEAGIDLTTSIDIPEEIEPTLDEVFGSFDAALPIEEGANVESESDISIEVEKNQELPTQSASVSEEIKRSLLATQSTGSNLKLQPSPVLNSVKINRPIVRVDLELLERLSHIGGELLINHNRQANINEQLQAAIAQLRWRHRRHQQTTSQIRDSSDRMFSTQERQSALQIADFRFQIDNKNSESNLQSEISNLKLIKSSFDSLELDRYSELHVLLQSVLEEMVQLEEAADSIDLLTRQSSQILEKQRRLLNTVQEDMQSARMSPTGDIFNRFPRLLQQLSVAHKKPVELTLLGTDVLVDRALAEKLYDPLLHLVRNAFDHGIEPPEVRASRGKTETGKIEIRAYHQGNQTIIEVSDDGGGINCDRVRQRAVELNWMSAEQANKLSEVEVLDLLFQPGFSTASKLSDLSGRGVGLDAVRAQMQALSGSVIVRSQPQFGTTFLLQFPLSLTMAKLMICEVGGTVYALLSDAIEQILIPKSDQIQHNNGHKVLHLSGGGIQSIVPAYNMTELLGGSLQISDLRFQRQNKSEISNLKSNPMLLIRQRHKTGLSENSELVGLEVDNILGEQELVIRPLGKAIAPPSYVYGGSTLADGRLTLVIDSTALVNSWLDKLSAQLHPDFRFQIDRNSALNLQSEISNLQLTQLPPAIVLVVDDSISVRQSLALTLQKAGYKVLQAQNGREALQQLKLHREIRLVICDIEMPSMNGFEFLTYCRQDAELAGLPVVMLTSRTAEKHRRLALELGAVGYFNKPFQEQEICLAIADLINQNQPVVGKQA